MTDARANAAVPPPRGMGGRRWTICALLFFATTINYLDRAVITVLAPTLLDHFHWSKEQYAFYVANGFQIAYCAGLLLAGGLIDRLGTRKGFTLFVTLWSAAGVLTGFATGLWTFAAARFALGLGEGGNFPASIKTVAEWFPQKERALAAGILNSGTGIGSVVAPLLAADLAVKYGWQVAFYVTGALGFVWIVAWLAIYKRPAEDMRLSRGELEYIESGITERTEKVPWSRVLMFRQTWAFALGKFLTDPIFWFWLFWMGIFLKDRFGTKLENLKGPLVLIYFGATMGSIGGGWLSSALLKRGWSCNAARKTAMGTCAVLVIPVLGALYTKSMWTAAALVSVAAAAHQAWSSNIFTLVSDMFPRRAVGSVVGFGGMMGALGSVLLQIFAGKWLNAHPTSYLPFFCVAASGYTLALCVIHLLAPTLEPVVIDTAS